MARRGRGRANSGTDGLALMNALYECTLNVRNAVRNTMAAEGVAFVTPEEALTLAPLRSTLLSYCVRSAQDGERALAYLVDDARAFARSGPEPRFSLSDVRITQERDVRESYTLMRLALYMHDDADIGRAADAVGTDASDGIEACTAVGHDY